MIFDPSGWGFWVSVRFFRQYFRWFVFLSIGMTLTSCAAKQTAPDREFTPETTITREVETRGSVYVYGQGQPTGADRIELKLNGEPLLLPSGYARIVGVVSGGCPVACFEIGGRGVALGLGDKLDGYQLVSIDDKGIILQKGR
jgi:hypothetical protein